MSDVSRDDPHHARLVADLVDDLRPVRRIGAPLVRALGWLAVVLALALALAWFADMPAVEHRLMAVPDMWLSVLGSSLTAVFAAYAAFQLDVPDRSPLWSVLPLPGLVLWIGASGMGCARTWLISGTGDATMPETMQCLRFIIGLSLPLSVLIVLMLRRGYTLYPSLTGAVAGLGVAAAAATLLNFFHPFDAAILDLAVHFVAVTLVVMANRYAGGLIFGRRRPAAPR